MTPSAFRKLCETTVPETGYLDLVSVKRIRSRSFMNVGNFSGLMFIVKVKPRRLCVTDLVEYGNPPNLVALAGVLRQTLLLELPPGAQVAVSFER